MKARLCEGRNVSGTLPHCHLHRHFRNPFRNPFRARTRPR
jgi:hypothetical protein